MKLISTVALGRGAFGTVSFFQAPQGQRMHFLGNIPVDKVPKLDADTTTLKQASEAGVVTGSLRIKSIQARALRDTVDAEGNAIRVPFANVPGGIEVFAIAADAPTDHPVPPVLKGALLELYEKMNLPKPLLLQETDAFEVKVSLDKELELTAKAFEMNEKQFERMHPYVLLQIEIEAELA